MENKLRFTDYLNHASFMRIEEVGNHYQLTMKSIIDMHADNKFHSLDGLEVSAYKYIVYFYKAEL